MTPTQRPATTPPPPPPLLTWPAEAYAAGATVSAEWDELGRLYEYRIVRWPHTVIRHGGPE